MSGVTQERDILNQEKLLEIVQKIEKTEDVKILESHVRSGTSAGENYSGDIQRVTLKALLDGSQTRDYNWMVKLPPKDPSTMAMTQAFNLEGKEFGMYRDFLPGIRKLISDRNADVKLSVPPAPYLELNTPDKDGTNKPSILVMEDMSIENFRDPYNKKSNGLGLEYAKLTVMELAKLHACGYAYIKSYPGGIKEGIEKNHDITYDTFCEHQNPEIKALMDRFRVISVQGWAVLLEGAQDPGEDLAGMLKRYHEDQDLFDARDKCYISDPNGFNVVCHGDAWFNNILFQHEESESDQPTPTKALLVDLALTRWTSPVTDLIYFLFLSTKPETREKHFEEIMKSYHDTLTSVLEKLGEDPNVYSYEQLVKDYDDRCFFGLLQALMVVPAVLSSKEEAITPEEFGVILGTDEDARKRALETAEAKTNRTMKKNPLLKTMIQGSFHEMIKRGHFDKYKC